MGIGKTGFDTMDEADKEFSGGGGGGDGKAFDFFQKPDEKHLLLFLDDLPYTYWEHGMYGLTHRAGDREVCLARNHIEKVCPVCVQSEKNKELNLWPSFVGLLTVVDCGSVTRNATTKKMVLSPFITKKGIKNQFQRKLLRAKKGGKDKPGMLPKLRRMSEDHGGLYGTLWTTYRGGAKEESIGTEWTYIGKIDISNLDALKEALVKLEGSDLSGVEDARLKYLKAEPFDYDTVVQASSAKELERYFVGYVPAEPSSAGDQSSGADEEIPFN